MLYDPEEFDATLLVTDDLALTVQVPQHLEHCEEWQHLLKREGWLGALQPSDQASEGAHTGQLLSFFNGYRVRVCLQAQAFNALLVRPDSDQQMPALENLNAAQLTELLRGIEALPAPTLNVLGSL